jgi:hypothetical protein
MLIVALGTLLLCSTGAAAFDLGEVVIHGFVTETYIQTTDNNIMSLESEEGAWDWFEAGINFTVEPVDRLRIAVQVYARDLGKQGNGNLEIDWAVGDYRWRDWLGIRMGKVKTSFGFYNEVRDADMARPSIMQPQAIYPETQRDFLNAFLGGELYGTVPIGAAGDLQYQVYTGTVDLDDAYVVRRSLESGAAAGLNSLPIPLSNAFYSIDNIKGRMEHLVGGVLRWLTPVEGLRFGVTYQEATSKFSSTTTYSGWLGEMPMTFTIGNETIYDQQGAWVASAEYRRGRLLAAAEFYESKNAVTNRITGLPVPDMPPSVQTAQAYYAQVAYRFTDWLQLSTYYAESFNDKDDKDGRGLVARGRPAWHAWDDDLALTARFDITRHWLFKLEAHFHDGGAALNSIENPDGFERDWTVLLGRATFYF